MRLSVSSNAWNTYDTFDNWGIDGNVERTNLLNANKPGVRVPRHGAAPARTYSRA